jgi:hypothetical protein
METLGIEHVTGMVLTFIKTADAPAVIMLLTLCYILLRAIWIPHRYRIPTLALVALLLAVPITYVFSVAPETHWSTRLFWRSCLQNGAVAVVLWHLLLPRFLKKWPLHAEHPLPLPMDAPPHATLWHEPVEKKKSRGTPHD